MYEIKKIGKVLKSKFVGTVPSSYEKRIYRAAVSQSLRNTGLDHWFKLCRGSLGVCRRFSREPKHKLLTGKLVDISLKIFTGMHSRHQIYFECKSALMKQHDGCHSPFLSIALRRR